MAPFILHLLRVCWLPVASFFAGVLNSIAGGGSFLSLPALLAGTTAAGVGAVSAQATNTVALWPGQLTSLVAFRKQLGNYGWKLLPLVILLSAASGAVLGILMIVMRGRDRAAPMPFGPYLAAAGWLAMLYGDTLVTGYLRLSGLQR